MKFQLILIFEKYLCNKDQNCEFRNVSEVKILLNEKQFLQSFSVKRFLSPVPQIVFHIILSNDYVLMA